MQKRQMNLFPTFLLFQIKKFLKKWEHNTEGAWVSKGPWVIGRGKIKGCQTLSVHRSFNCGQECTVAVWNQWELRTWPVPAVSNTLADIGIKKHLVGDLFLFCQKLGVISRKSRITPTWQLVDEKANMAPDCGPVPLHACAFPKYYYAHSSCSALFIPPIFLYSSPTLFFFLLSLSRYH